MYHFDAGTDDIVLTGYTYRYYESGGFSTLAVDSLEVEMSEVLTRVIRKRRLQIHGEG